MKAIIPVAGIGSRLRPHTHTQPKSLIPVAGKPILAHIVDSLIKEQIDEFVFIIGYLGDKIEKYIKTTYPQVTSHFVVQADGKGTGHALWLAQELFNDGKPIIIVFGDTIVQADLKKILNSEKTLLGVKRVNDPRYFGVAEIDDDGLITRLIEKPNIPKSNQALVGIYKICETKQLVDALNYNIEHEVISRGEYQLTDALMRMIENGVKMYSYNVEAWFDCGKKDILLKTNAILLKSNNYKKANINDYSNSIIIEPVFIGKNSQISNSIIGPNVSIGDDVILNYSIIKNSIIGPYSHLENANLDNSIIGNDASLRGLSLTLNLGDSTEINFG
ncbi:MAG: NTP transferase domain-containing protein [Bacteroidetes bacterium]|nr:NTP transferase domain-containing protein [Bacteroidota bacterium]